jgi:hypothetical protein
MEVIRLHLVSLPLAAEVAAVTKAAAQVHLVPAEDPAAAGLIIITITVQEAELVDKAMPVVMVFLHLVMVVQVNVEAAAVVVKHKPVEIIQIMLVVIMETAALVFKIII